MIDSKILRMGLQDVQFHGRIFLQDIPRHRIEDEKQGLIRETAHLLVNRTDVVDRITFRNVVIWLYWS